MFDPSQPARDGWVLKGGYALEMRFHMARSTKDLDLTVRSAQGRAGDAISLRELLLAASIELPDFFTFIVADLYRTKVESLPSALQREDTRLEASEMLRGLIDSIVLIPDEGQLRIELRGNLAAMLTAAQQTKRSPETGDLLVPVQLVAGARNPLNLEFCWAAG